MLGLGLGLGFEDISAKTRASSVNPLNNSCYLVGILCLNSPTILCLSNNDDTQRGLGLGLGGDKFPQDS